MHGLTFWFRLKGKWFTRGMGVWVTGWNQCPGICNDPAGLHNHSDHTVAGSWNMCNYHHKSPKEIRLRRYRLENLSSPKTKRRTEGKSETRQLLTGSLTLIVGDIAVKDNRSLCSKSQIESAARQTRSCEIQQISWSISTFFSMWGFRYDFYGRLISP